MGTSKSVAIPSGSIYPEGIGVTRPDGAVQSTTHIPGSFFQKSPGIVSMRPGKHRLQKGFHGHGIHFTPQRFAEDIGAEGLPLMVDPATASKHADIAELPGSERLDDEGAATREEDRILLAESDDLPTATKSVEARHAHSVDLTGVRTESRRWGQGLLHNPVNFLSSEYRRTPVKAVAIAGLIVTAVNLVAREFERSYNRRKRSAGIAAAPVAATETVGATAATVVATPTKVVKEVAQGADEVAQAVAETIEDATGAATSAAS